MSVQRCPKTGSGNRPPGEKDVGAEKLPFKRSLKNFWHSGRPSDNVGLEGRIWLDQLAGKRLRFITRSVVECGLRRLPDVEPAKNDEHARLSRPGECWSGVLCARIMLVAGLFILPTGRNRRRFQARKPHRVRRSTVRLPISDESMTETRRALQRFRTQKTRLSTALKGKHVINGK